MRIALLVLVVEKNKLRWENKGNYFLSFFHSILRFPKLNKILRFPEIEENINTILTTFMSGCTYTESQLLKVFLYSKSTETSKQQQILETKYHKNKQAPT